MIVEQGNIPYADLTRDLFGRDRQVRIPFLGAGVSISGNITTRTLDPPARSRDPRIREALDCLSQSGDTHTDNAGAPLPSYGSDTLLFLELAMDLALDLEKSKQEGAPSSDIFERIVSNRFPPSSSELTEVFRAGLRPFEDVADSIAKRLGHTSDLRSKTVDLLRMLAALAGVTSPSLSAMSAYFERLNSRDEVLRRIGSILKDKACPTETHKLLARAAAKQVQRGSGHCLIITTNYDTLMEKAIEDWTHAHALDGQPSWLPYVVLWLSNKDYLTRARFGNMPPEMIAQFEECNPPAPPNGFTLKQPTPQDQQTESPPVRFVIIHKMHGCIHPVLNCPRLQESESAVVELPENCFHDSIVLSEDDYIQSIARLADNGGVIPSCVSEIMRRKPLLFLGYSLNDWNIRGFLKVLRAKGAGSSSVPDYTVVRNVRTLEDGFFAKNNIVVLRTDLNDFAGNLGRIAAESFNA